MSSHSVARLSAKSTFMSLTYAFQTLYETDALRLLQIRLRRTVPLVSPSLDGRGKGEGDIHPPPSRGRVFRLLLFQRSRFINIISPRDFKCKRQRLAGDAAFSTAGYDLL